MRTLDRYIIREILPPFCIALLVFTFILIIPFIIELAEQMIAKGVPWSTILRLAVTLLPSSVAVTIPMALLIGILDRKSTRLNSSHIQKSRMPSSA